MVNQKFIKETIKLLHHYGFQDIQLMQIPAKSKPQFKMHMKDLDLVHSYEKEFFKNFKVIAEKSIHLEKTPAMVYFWQQSAIPDLSALSLNIVGAKTVMAEMMLISAIVSSLRRNGLNEILVKVNSVGDAESKEKYVRDLKAFFKKHSKFIPEYAKKEIEAKRFIKALKLIKERDETIVSTAPQPIDYLSDQQRTYLKQIIDFLEYLDVDYFPDPLFVGSLEYWKNTLFEIQINHNGVEKVVARGGRYSELPRKTIGKKVEIVGANVYINKTKSLPAIRPRKFAPKAFVSFIGPEAQKKALTVLDAFYEAGIPIVNSFLKHSLIEQMKDLKKVDVPYLVIIGHKEALENSVIVRNVIKNTQKTIPVSRLKAYMSRLK